MDKLRKHIKETFFNPILHFLPLLLFLVIDDFYDIFLAWEVSFPFAFILLIYIYFVFNRIFILHLFTTIIFVLAALITALESFFPLPFLSHDIIFEIVIFLFFVSFIVFKRKIKKFILHIMSNLTPMTNNFEELYRVIWAFSIVLFLYLSAFLMIDKLYTNVEYLHGFIQSVYIALLSFISFYEILRVRFIRSKLIREKWLPIVNNSGRIIGSIQHNISTTDEKKYQHPVIRILIIDKGMILLTKRKSYENNKLYEFWDSTLFNHIVMGESIENCVNRTAESELKIEQFKYMYLSTYPLDFKNEIQYTFLFVSCLQSELKFNFELGEQTKWWTQNQIEEELESGILTDNFKIEYDLLKRSGLLESEKCQCNCKLKEVIYKQPDSVKFQINNYH